MVKLEKPRLNDASEIHRIVNLYAKNGDLLPLSLVEIYEDIRDFFVARGGDGRVLGVSALKVAWEDLAEIRSLAVLEEYRGKGIGGMLVKACFEEANRLGVKRLFVLTKRPSYFGRFGFKEVDRHELPFKVWMDCLRCPKYPDYCDEVAMQLLLKR